MNKQLKVLAAASLENSLTLESLLNREGINRMATIVPEPDNVDRAASLPVDAVVLLSPSLTEEECAFIEALYMTRERLALVLICERPEGELMARAMNCGISRVLTLSMTPEAITAGIEEAVLKVRNRQESASVREFDSRLISIFSTKGGSGKTTIAVNMAVAMARLGKRVVLVDLDLQFGDVGVFLNVSRSDTISELAGEPQLSASVINSYLDHHSSGVDVLLAPLSPEMAELVKTEHVDRILTVLRAEYDAVICDLAPSLDDTALLAVDRSDVTYFVTNPEVSVLKNTHTCLNVLKTLHLSDAIRLVLNKEGDAFVSRRDVRTALEQEPVFGFPCDAKTSACAINRGIPVVLSYPKTKLARAFADFAAYDAGLTHPKEKRSFFRKK